MLGRLLPSPIMSNGILIVDDNGSIRRLLRNFVETNTHFKVCGEAENGAEALRMAKGLRPDLVLVDLTMPGMSGTETATALRRLEPRPKIILFTLHADGVNKELASVFGIDVVLSKTESTATLAAHINALLMPGAEVAEDIAKSQLSSDISGKPRLN